LPANAAAAEVTFQVNLKIQTTLGNFDARAHTAEVHGSFDGWGSGFQLFQSPGDPNVYLGSTDVSNSDGVPVEYKFVINKQGTLSWEGNVGPGGPNGNRTFTATDSEQVLPAVYFDNLSTDPGAGVPVTFQVDMAVQIAMGTFDPDGGSVVVAGSFNNWATDASPLTPVAPASTVYRGSALVKASAGSSIPYKFVANGSNWEAGDNRLFTLATPEQTLPAVFFNRVENLGLLGIVPSASGEITLTWTAAPRVRVQSAAGAGAEWHDVPDSQGLDTVTLPSNDPIRIFRLIGP
jgi:hypothetical protein